MEYFVTKLDRYFHNYEALGGMFVIKPYGEKGYIPPHQDYCFVDEKNTIQTYKTNPNVFLHTVWDLAMGHKPITELIKETQGFNFEPNGKIIKEKIVSWIENERASLNLFSEYEFKQTYILRDQEIEKEINKQGFTIIKLLTEA